MKKPDCKTCRREHSAEFAQSTFGLCCECKPMQKYDAYLADKRKFVSGDPITSLNELLEQEWVIANGRAKHIKAVKNMQFATVLKWLESGIFRKALRKEMVIDG